MRGVFVAPAMCSLRCAHTPSPLRLCARYAVRIRLRRSGYVLATLRAYAFAAALLSAAIRAALHGYRQRYAVLFRLLVFPIISDVSAFPF